MHVIDATEAEAQFGELLRRVEAGQEVVVTRAGEPVARVVPARASTRRPRFGAAKGLLRAHDDFEAPLRDFEQYSE